MPFVGTRFILFTLFLSLLSSLGFGFDKQADAFRSAQTHMDQGNNAAALADADAGLTLATNQAEQVAARTLRAQILNASGKADEARAEYRKIIEVGNTRQQVTAFASLADLVRLSAQSAAKPDAAEAELRSEMEKLKLTGAQKVFMLHHLIGRGNYQDRKRVMDELLKISAEENVRLETLQDPISGWTFYRNLVNIASMATVANEFKAAEWAYRKAIALAPENTDANFGAAEMALLRGDAAAAQADLQKVLDNPKAKSSDRYVARILQLASASQGAEEFRRQIARIDKEFAAEKFSEEQRFKLLREAALRLFTASRYDDVRALETEAEGMQRPEPKKEYVCHYVKDAPRSADSWARTPLLRDSRYKESRFEPYALADLSNPSKSDVAKLKGASAAGSPSKDGYDTSVYIVYDERGLHLYAQCNDPEARKVEQGLVSGGQLEMYIQPGKDTAYHQWWFNLPGVEESNSVNWDTPHRHYRYTQDYLVKNTVVSDGVIGAYTFIPWLMVYDKLPSESNPWGFSMQRFSPNGAVTLGGAVHELGRAVRLSFEMPADKLLAVKREVVVRAFAKYQNERKRSDGVSIWSDPELGDPEFHKSAIAPLLEKLDTAGEGVNDKMSDDDIKRLFDQAVPDWMELSHKVAELRAAYLRNLLLRGAY